MVRRTIIVIVGAQLGWVLYVFLLCGDGRWDVIEVVLATIKYI